MSDQPDASTALALTRDAALARAEFPFARVARWLGIDPSGAEVALRDEDRAGAAVKDAADAYLAADDARRAGRVPSSPIAADPDFPTGVGMALVGASVLWDRRDLVPQLALRVAKDHHEAGDEELAASYIALVQEFSDAGEDDATAWAAQSLLVAVLQRSGSAEAADVLARDLAAHHVPLDLWRDDDPSLPDESMEWHGGAFVGGMPPRRDERHLSYEDAHDYLGTLLAQMRRDEEAEEGPGEEPEQ